MLKRNFARSFEGNNKFANKSNKSTDDADDVMPIELTSALRRFTVDQQRRCGIASLLLWSVVLELFEVHNATARRRASVSVRSTSRGKELLGAVFACVDSRAALAMTPVNVNAVARALAMHCTRLGRPLALADVDGKPPTLDDDDDNDDDNDETTKTTTISDEVTVDDEVWRERRARVVRDAGTARAEFAARLFLRTTLLMVMFDRLKLLKNEIEF